MRWIKTAFNFVKNLFAPQPQLTVRTTEDQRSAMGEEIRTQKARGDMAGRVTVED